MKFLSALFFNRFKNTGNIRLMFVVCCLFGLISLFIVLSNAFVGGYAYYYHVNIADSPEYSDIRIYGNSETAKKHRELLRILETRQPFVDLCIAGRPDDVFEQVQKVYPYAGYEKDFKTGTELCERLTPQYDYKIYSFAYLWNLLWVIFWFYLPFLLVFPVKFIVDGYQKDKKVK